MCYFSLFKNGVFEYFCILGSQNSLGIALIGYDWKAETLVDPMRPTVFICDDVSPDNSHFQDNQSIMKLYSNKLET